MSQPRASRCLELNCTFEKERSASETPSNDVLRESFSARLHATGAVVTSSGLGYAATGCRPSAPRGEKAVHTTGDAMRLTRAVSASVLVALTFSGCGGQSQPAPATNTASPPPGPTAAAPAVDPDDADETPPRNV